MEPAATKVDAAPTFEASLKDEEDRLLQSFDRIVAEASARIVASLPAGAPWPERLAAALWTMFELVEADHATARFMFVDAKGISPAVTGRYLATIERAAQFMREGRAVSGARVSMPPLTDTVIPAGVAFMVGRQLREAPGDAVAPLFPDALRLLLMPYLGDAETTRFLAYNRSGPPCPDVGN